MKTSGLDVHKDNISCAIYDGQKYTKTTENYLVSFEREEREKNALLLTNFEK
jgi:hypothetical protein